VRCIKLDPEEAKQLKEQRAKAEAEQKKRLAEICPCVDKMANAKNMEALEKIIKECDKVDVKEGDAEKCENWQKAENNINRITEEEMLKSYSNDYD
jgi:hypothetical protein